MSHEEFFKGTDVIGSDEVGADVSQFLSAAQGALQGARAGAPTAEGPFVTIHVRDPKGLVAAKGGAAGAAAFNLIPGTVTGKIYSDMRSQIAQAMKDQGVDADVQVVDNRPAGGALPHDFLIGSLIGAGSVGLVWSLVAVIKHFRKK
jgi:hypothetical protein